MQLRTVPAGDPARLVHVRRGERARLERWGAADAATETTFVTTADGWALAVSRYRPAETSGRRPVVLCHGLGANRLAFDTDPRFSLAVWLAERGWDVHSVELRGHGLSEKPVRPAKHWDWDFNTYCDIDLPAALDAVLELTEREQVHLVGHSMGGILLYARAGLGETRIRSGITIGSTLNYAGLPTMFRHLAPLAALTFLMPRVPIDLPARASSVLSRVDQRFVDPALVVAANVDLDVYRKMTATVLHPVSAGVLRDLACAINGRGLRAADGRLYEELLAERGYTFPILAVAGSHDTQCGTTAAARFGTDTAFFGRRFGQRENYSHHDLIMGLHAREEVWPRIAGWLAQHDDGGGSPGVRASAG